MDIYGIVDTQRGALLAREYKTVKDILRAYEQAEGSVEKMIRSYQKKITKAKKAGLEPSLAWVYQEVRLENLLHELRLQLEDFSKDALEFTEKGKKNAYELGAVHALRLGEASVIGDFAGLNAGAMQTGQFLLASQSPLKKLFDEIAPNATTAARKIFADSLALGWNPRKTGRVLKKKITELSKHRAEMIARTEMIRAYRVANQQVYKRNSDVLRGWRWTAAKTPATCSLCLALDGEIYPVEDVIKSHPSCRCSMVPLPNTDFGGPEPSSGEEYFAKLPEKDQVKILGKKKTELYRKGEISLKDNVSWRDHPEWGRSPKPRTLSDLRTQKLAGNLPSQTGSKISTFQPQKARKLSDLLTESERTSNDPIQKALKSWADAPKDKAGAKTTIKAVKTADYKKTAPKKIAEGVQGLVSEVSEVAISDMTATIPYVSEAKVQAYIKAGGDGFDLPVLVKQGEKLFIHDGDSLARLEAKKQLGQTKASVRIFDADQFKVETNPTLAVEKELKALGVQKIEVIDDTIDKEQALAWVKARIEATGHSPKSVFVGGGKTVLSPDGELIVGRNFDFVGSVADKDQIKDAVQDSWISLTDTKLAETQYAEFKVARLQASTSVAENIEAVMIRQKIGVGNFYGGDGVKKLTEDFATKNYELFSLRAFDSNSNDLVQGAVEELIVLYRKGEYRLGSLPNWLENDVISKLEKEFGKKTLLPAFEGEQKILGIQIGGQGGSNPGGMYLGRDGVKRYVKFYPQADRAETEVLANAVYEALGIDVPKTTSFLHQGKTAFASEIIQGGKTIQQLGGVQNLSIETVEEVLKGYVADALLANWDVVGLSADNIMINGSKVYRIDNGGTFIFRAQGGDKPDSLLQNFEELTSLGGKSSKGYVGQMNQFIQRLGGNDADAIVDRIKVQGEKTLDFLNGVTKGATTEANKRKKWIEWIDKTAPTMSTASKNRITSMMLKRTQLLEEKLAAISQAQKPIKAGKIPKTLQAMLKTPEAKPLMRAGGSTNEYDKILEKITDAAFDRMSPDAKRAAYEYSGGSYNAVFNDPQRQYRKTKAPITSYSKKMIKDLETAIEANHEGLPQDALIYRKLDGTRTESRWDLFEDKDVGTIISDSAFMSSSLNANVWSGNTHLHITMRKGETRFIAPGKRAKDGQHPGEHEFILGNNLLMLVKKVEYKSGVRILHVEVLPKGFKLPKGTVIKYARRAVSRVQSFFANEPKDLTPMSENATVHNSGQTDEFMDVFRFSQCLSCESYARQGRCVAFPEGIPTEILTGAFDHRKAFSGDLGVRFSPGGVRYPSLNDDDTQSSREEALRYEKSSDSGQALLEP